MAEKPSFLKQLWELPGKLLDGLDDPLEDSKPGGLDETAAHLVKRYSRPDAPIDGD